MTSPLKLNLKICQGSTLKEVFHWETSVKTYVPITGITKSAPVVITAPGHSIPIGWRTKIHSVLGMKEINSEEEFRVVTNKTTDTITLGCVSSLLYTSYTSGGTLEYYPPVDLTGYTSRLQIRDKVSSETVLTELTTENSGIILDSTAGTVTIILSATATAALTFKSAVYSLEMIKAGEVTTLLTGTVILSKEITR